MSVCVRECVHGGNECISVVQSVWLGASSIGHALQLQEASGTRWFGALHHFLVLLRGEVGSY